MKRWKRKGDNCFCCSNDEPIGNVSSGRFGCSNDFDDLTSLEAVVSRHRISGLDPHQLILLQTVLDQQLALLLRRHDDVLGNQLVLGDVDQQLGLEKLKQKFEMTNRISEMGCKSMDNT